MKIWYQTCATSNKHTLNSEVKDHLVCPFSTWAGTNSSAINFTRVIHLVTMVAGKQHVLVTTIKYIIKISIFMVWFLIKESFFFKTAISILKQEYKIGETKLTDALKLAVKILSKTLDTTKLTSEKSKIFALLIYFQD